MASTASLSEITTPDASYSHKINNWQLLGWSILMVPITSCSKLLMPPRPTMERNAVFERKLRSPEQLVEDIKEEIMKSSQCLLDLTQKSTAQRAGEGWRGIGHWRQGKGDILSMAGLEVGWRRGAGPRKPVFEIISKISIVRIRDSKEIDTIPNSQTPSHTRDGKGELTSHQVDTASEFKITPWLIRRYRPTTPPVSVSTTATRDTEEAKDHLSNLELVQGIL
uniref:Uncharacterized protein n=1 Tax=Oryza glumipatula TaxID=40148 RepID=A0A0E0BUQ0_9ORYZ